MRERAREVDRPASDGDGASDWGMRLGTDQRSSRSMRSSRATIFVFHLWHLLPPGDIINQS